MSIKEITELAKTCSEPICRVIDYTLGPIFKPIEKITTAKAECYISNMQKQNEYGLTKKEFHALKRECFFAEQRQKNMGGILQKAIPNINTNDEKLNSISPDWFMNYREKASLVSNEDLQYLWATILSGEVNSPGKYSLQTLNILTMIDEKIAAQINKLFQYVVKIEEKFYLFCPYYTPVFAVPEEYTIYDNDLIQIESLGIIKTYDNLGVAKKVFNEYKEYNLFYLNKTISFFPIKNNANEYTLNLGRASLTNVGEELFSLNKQDFHQSIFYLMIHVLQEDKRYKVKPYKIEY